MDESQHPVLIDETLVQAASGGDKKALNLLMSKYESKTLAYVSRHIRQPVDAHDICQEIFIKLMLAIPHYRQDASFRTWYFQIVKNTLKNYYRRQQNKSALLCEGDLFEQHKSNSSPFGAYCYRKAIERMECVLETMPQSLRETLSYRDARGYSYQEIAELMKCPIGTVRSRIARARRYLQQALKAG